MMNYDQLAAEFTGAVFSLSTSFLRTTKSPRSRRELRANVNITKSILAKSAGIVVYEPNTKGKIRNLFAMERYDDYFANLAQAPEFLKLAARIFDDVPALMGVELFGKPAMVGSEVPHHQDNAYFTSVLAMTFYDLGGFGRCHA